MRFNSIFDRMRIMDDREGFENNGPIFFRQVISTPHSSMVLTSLGQ